jgi:hypothetical protein
MNKLKLILLGAALLSLPISTNAQNESDYGRYMSTAQDASILYRGKQAMRYQMLYNGTYLWFPAQFEKGDLVYNGKKYHGILMNIDAFRQELLIKHPNNVVTIVLNGNFVGDFDIGGQPFVNLAAKGFKNAREGYSQVLYKGGASLYKHIEKSFDSDVNLQNGAAIGYVDPNFRKDVYDFFSQRIFYYLEKDGVLTQVKGSSGITNCFPDKKKEIKKHMKRKGLNFKEDPDAYYVEVMNFIDSMR